MKICEFDENKYEDDTGVLKWRPLNIDEGNEMQMLRNVAKSYEDISDEVSSRR